MFESEARFDDSSKISIGRISFCVVTALPLILLLRLWKDPGLTKDEMFGDFMQSIIVVLISLLLTCVGAIIVVGAIVKKLPILFWSIALFFAALPLLVAIIAVLAPRH
ncbi:MAG: hypothetical protein ABI791_12585 [Acidobacteriota bacterium]